MTLFRSCGGVAVVFIAVANGCFQEQPEVVVAPEPTVTEVRGACKPGIAPPANGLASIVEIASPGGKRAYVEDINDDGVAVGGETMADGNVHAFRHTDRGGVQDLGALSGFGSQSFATSIAANGAVGGHSDRADGTGLLFGFGYTAQAGRQGLCPGGCSVWDVNSKGELVGLFPGRDPTTWQAFVFSPSVGTTLLGTLGGARSSASGISDAGVVVGNAQPAGASPDDIGHAFVYDSRAKKPTLRDLNTMARTPGWVLQAATDVNDRFIVGYGLRGEDRHAFRLDVATGDVLDIGLLPDTVATSGWSVNVYGDVVGWAETTERKHVAFIHAAGLGGLRRLDQFTDLAQGWRLQQAAAINNRGSIVGWGSRMGNPRGFKITFPICLPSEP
jgi:probable HAF family extracellular repeat protein